ncbi:hypothetical protein C8R45DRAFT_933932 [Mycena sanguinolenta]|nr:hypothetical protein C8R45DRAFT_933932 [Mycena sanguinolenta]
MCRAFAQDGSPCECEEYDAPVDENAQSLCRECGHGKSRHGHPASRATQLPLPSKPSVTNQATVFDVFQAHSAHVERSVGQRLPMTSRATDYSTAKEDAMKGFRPKSGTKEDKKDDKKLKRKVLFLWLCPLDQAQAKKKKQDPKSSSKETMLSQVILLTCGVKTAQKNGQKKKELRGSSKALSPIDIMNRFNHGCVSSMVKANVEWTNDECTKFLSKLFPKAFQSSDSSSWYLVSKSYHKLEVVPILKPTGKDMANFKNKKDGSLYIVLGKQISVNIYESWYKGNDHEPSSDVESIHSDDDSEDGGSESEQLHESDYDPTKDQDADDDDDTNFTFIPQRYETREDPELSKRKRESLEDSDADERHAKRTKLSAFSQSAANPSGSTSSKREPLFLPSPGPPAVENLEPSSSSAKHTRHSQKCKCRKISPPSLRVISKIHGTMDDIDTALVQTYTNPWDESYQPPIF